MRGARKKTTMAKMEVEMKKRERRTRRKRGKWRKEGGEKRVNKLREEIEIK